MFQLTRPFCVRVFYSLIPRADATQVGASLEHTVLAATNAFRICLWFSATLTAAEQDAVAYRWRSKLGVKMPTDPTGVFSARLGAGPDQSPRPFEFAFQGPSGAAVIPSAEPAKSECAARLPPSRSVRFPFTHLLPQCLGFSILFLATVA